MKSSRPVSESNRLFVSRASIVWENILQFSEDSLRSTLAGHFQSRENEKMCNSPLVTHYLQVNQCEDNNTLQLNNHINNTTGLQYISSLFITPEGSKII